MAGWFHRGEPERSIAVGSDPSTAPSIAGEEIVETSVTDVPLPAPAPALDSDIDLPRAVTRFIGRERDSVAVQRLLARHRLVTLTGPGGVGKSRLAVAVAGSQQRWHRVRMADLAPVNSNEHVPGEIAAALGARTIEAALEQLGSVPTLVLLDNCEHLVDAVARIADSVLRSSAAVLLATSRVPLNVEGERVYSVRPLTEREAVALFEDRSHEDVLPSADVEHICQRLDRLPLALELAAARTRVMSVASLKASLDNSLGVLERPRTEDDRRRSLEASIRWSYDDLGAAEQAVFRQLAVFQGPFDLDAATSITGADQSTVLALADHSLLVREGDRYRFLYPVREFARKELVAAAEEELATERHDEYFVRWAATQRDPIMLRRADAIRSVWSERDEIRPALDRLAERSPDKFATLASVFARALVDWGDVPYADELARRAAGVIDDEHPHAAFIHLSAGVLAWGVRDLDRALTEARNARRLAAKSGDKLVEARARNSAAIALSNLGRREEALEELRAGLESLGDSLPEVRYSMQNVMAMQYWLAGLYAEGAEAARRALAISSEATVSRAMTVGTLAICLAGLGDAVGAAEAQREAADLMIRFDVRGSAPETLVNFGRIALVAGDEAQAAAFLAAGKRLAAELRSVVEHPLWNDPGYAALIERHSDTATSLDGLGWEDALRLAIAWRPLA